MAIPGTNATSFADDLDVDITKTQLKTNPAVSVDQNTEWDMDSVVVDRVKDNSGNKTDSKTKTDRSNGKADKTALGSSSIPSAPAGSIMGEASRHIGTKYVFGGSSPAGFDCSGFVQYLYNRNGIAVPRTAGGQAKVGVPVSIANARPGDIVTWGYHSGIYAGNGMVLHASKPGISSWLC